MTERLERAIAHEKGEMELMWIDHVYFAGDSCFPDESVRVVVAWNGSTVVTIRGKNGQEIRLFTAEVQEILTRIRAEERRRKNRTLYEKFLRVQPDMGLAIFVTTVLLWAMLVTLVFRALFF